MTAVKKRTGQIFQGAHFILEEKDSIHVTINKPITTTLLETAFMK
jgi:hypothetical protein